MAEIETVTDEAKGTYVHVMDVLKTSTERSGEYFKSVWELNTKSYTGGFDDNLHEAFERADATATLATRELEATAHSAIDILETLVEATLSLNRRTFDIARKYAKQGADNFKTVAEKAGDRFERAAGEIGEKVNETAHAG